MTTRTMPKPDPAREPMKVNVYWFAQSCPTALAPMFPYLDEGAIVPCVATFRGGPGKSFGRFQHFNTVDEIVVMWGASGAQRRGVGLVHVGPKLHLVEPMEHADSPDDMGLLVITQRQAIGKEQREEVRFICEKCDRRLFLYELDATPVKRGTKQAPGTYAFKTIIETSEAARRFNADEAARKCKHCGHQNPPFPSDAWAWDVYANQSSITATGSRSLGEAAHSSTGR
jgi:hypothetical protein